MKTVIQKLLKLSFEVAKRNGSHFEKTNGGSESAKLPDFCHGYVSICRGFFILIGLYVVNHNHLHHTMLARIRTKIEYLDSVFLLSSNAKEKTCNTLLKQKD